MLVERICKKIGIHSYKAKLKLSYIPFVLIPLKVVEILDDGDVIHEEFPGLLETPIPRLLMDLVLLKAGVQVSYPTTLRGKNLATAVVRGSPEDCYKKLPAYLYVLEKMNHGTKTCLLLDQQDIFKYLFIALGASIEEFRLMSKVITVDATFLKHGGALIFVLAQDGNHHHYPIAFDVVDVEKDVSWNLFFEHLSTVVPDGKELVFVSDRHVSIKKAIAMNYKEASHGYCVYHLSQNVRGKAPAKLKIFVSNKFMYLAGIYTQASFNRQYGDFLRRFPKVVEYLHKSVKVDK